MKSWTVCVIEPNKFEGQIILDLLRNAGVDRVKVCTEQDAANDLLEIYNANVVIASFEMGPLDGAAWTRAYRRNKRLPGRKQAIFITSGAFSLSMAEECRHAGANALIGKPISAKVLLATITKVLGKPREFIDAQGYVGPCRRAGIVTAGAPKKRRKADDSVVTAADMKTLKTVVDALVAAAAAYAADSNKLEGCELALRQVQAYAVNAGDGPLMRACAAFALQLSSAKGLRPEAVRSALEVCVNGVVKLVSLGPEQAARREEIAEGVRQAVGKAAMQRAA
ncbi:response regulator [Terricaulis sp.]|uniref:response regulator n=1 Tax=Terricaulis sp. TaxID=2768686 RepID=UPI002AC6B395|nr:response regulator [Terricaulis sp.]MDZ4693339.1 response regulator [Terricaulis sp.]